MNTTNLACLVNLSIFYESNLFPISCVFSYIYVIFVSAPWDLHTVNVNWRTLVSMTLLACDWISVSISTLDHCLHIYQPALLQFVLFFSFWNNCYCCTVNISTHKSSNIHVLRQFLKSNHNMNRENKGNHRLPDIQTSREVAVVLTGTLLFVSFLQFKLDT